MTDQEFTVAWRGYDRIQVEEAIAQLTERLQALEEERDRLMARPDDLPGGAALEEELSHVGRDVDEILTAARTAAEGMRARAASDAERLMAEAAAQSSRVRSEAQAEAAAAKSEAAKRVTASERQAQAAAEHVRGDAWEAADQLLQQAQQEAGRVTTAAQEEAMVQQSEAEREAHRLTNEAARDAQSEVRRARMEGERLLNEARAQHDEILDRARREAESAQERARALEQRRAELMEELEAARSAIERLEGEFEQRRHALRPPSVSQVEAAAVRVLGNEGELEEEPELSGEESVRVVPASRPVSAAPVDAEQLAAEVQRLRSAAEETVDFEAAAGPPEQAVEPEPEPEPDVEPEPAAAPGKRAGADIDRLFASLREGSEAPTAPAPSAPASSAPAPTASVAVALPTDVDPFEVRERLLLPIQNRVLRNVKRQLTEQQNIALEALRTSEGEWEPDAEAVARALRGDVVILVQESFAAAFAGVAELTGNEAGRPRSSPADLPDPTRELADELAEALSEVLAESRAGGRSGRDLSADVSRVFRSWRTDVAERRLRRTALESYHRGLSEAGGDTPHARVAWVVAGRGCAECRAAEARGPLPPGEGFSPEASVPPMHAGCECTLALMTAEV